MARASTPTFTPLDEVARIVGINPAHFNSAYAGDIAWQPCGECRDFWFSYPWQSAEGFSRDLLARAISEAETVLGQNLGYPLGPTMRKEVFDYNPHVYGFSSYTQELFGRVINYNGYGACDQMPVYYLGPHLRKYKPRKWTQVVTANVDDYNLVYNDQDGDEFAETATITFSLPQATAACNIGLFTYGYFGQATWRIRPLKSVSYQHNEDTDQYDYTVTVDAWQMIEPELWEEAPRAANMIQCGLRAIDMTEADTMVSRVHVGLLIEDPSFPLVKFRFERRGNGCGSSNCVVCNPREVSGCYAELTRAHDFVVPIPATYTEENGWCVTNPYTCCGITRGTVELTYWEGNERDYVADNLCGTAPNQALRQMVAYLAVARVQMGNCDCDCNKGQFWKGLGEDLTETKGAGRYLSFNVIDNPFGLTRGEIMAWQKFRAYTMNRPIVTYGAY